MSVPLYESLTRYARQVGLRLHMPGHAGGLGMADSALKALAALDVTEVPGIDDLLAPQHVLAESQRQAAQIYGAQNSCYLVNGASAGIHAMLLALCREGDEVLIPRNAHRSFQAGLILSGARPVYMPVQCEPQTGEAIAIHPLDLMEAVQTASSSCRALFVTSPSFLGVVQDCRDAAAAASSRKLPLCVDEAHGGHFAYSPSCPETALQCGAAAAVNGLHKNLPVLNQGAILHLGAAFPEPERAVQAVRLLSTTSPSYPILASIELALDAMQREGKALLERALDLRHAFISHVNTLPGLYCLDEEFLSFHGVVAVDPLKMAISCAGSGLSGYELDARLRQEKGIQVEMAGPGYILAMFSPWHTEAHWEELSAALAELAVRHPGAKPSPADLETAPTPISRLTPRQAWNCRWEKVPLTDAAGRVAAEMVAAYPPGIPCIVPGELVTPEIRDYLFYLKARAVRIQGPQDLNLDTLLVIND